MSRLNNVMDNVANGFGKVFGFAGVIDCAITSTGWVHSGKKIAEGESRQTPRKYEPKKEEEPVITPIIWRPANANFIPAVSVVETPDEEADNKPDGAADEAGAEENIPFDAEVVRAAKDIVEVDGVVNAYVVMKAADIIDDDLTVTTKEEGWSKWYQRKSWQVAREIIQQLMASRISKEDIANVKPDSDLYYAIKEIMTKVSAEAWDVIRGGCGCDPQLVLTSKMYSSDGKNHLLFNVADGPKGAINMTLPDKRASVCGSGKVHSCFAEKHQRACEELEKAGFTRKDMPNGYPIYFGPEYNPGAAFKWA